MTNPKIHATIYLNDIYQKDTRGDNMKLKPTVISFILMIAVIFILPFFGAEGYEIVKNTTSQLGAQNTPNAWVMNITFVCLGITYIYEVISLKNRSWITVLFISSFGLSLIGTALYSHAPITEGVSYSTFEDGVHSFFASTTGFGFVGFAMWTGLSERKRKMKVLGFGVGLLATLLSYMIFNFESLMGLWQRAMFVTSFAWLLYYLNYKRNMKGETYE